MGLSNVDNDSTSTIQSGTTAANVGLGNVTNESKATMLATSTLTGVTTAASLVLTPGSAPGSPAEGAMYYDSTTDTVKVRTASEWETLNNQVSASGGTVTTSAPIFPA